MEYYVIGKGDSKDASLNLSEDRHIPKQSDYEPVIDERQFERIVYLAWRVGKPVEELIDMLIEFAMDHIAFTDRYGTKIDTEDLFDL